MGSMLVAVIPSKSTKNIRRIPNPFSQPRLAIWNPEFRLCTPIKAVWDTLPEVGDLWTRNKACVLQVNPSVWSGTTCFGSLHGYLATKTHTREDRLNKGAVCVDFKERIPQKTSLGKSKTPPQCQFPQRVLLQFSLQEFTFPVFVMLIVFFPVTFRLDLSFTPTSFCFPDELEREWYGRWMMVWEWAFPRLFRRTCWCWTDLAASLSLL